MNARLALRLVGTVYMSALALEDVLDALEDSEGVGTDDADELRREVSAATVALARVHVALQPHAEEGDA